MVNDLIDRLLEIDADDNAEYEMLWLSEVKAYAASGGDITELSNRNNWQLIHIAALNGIDSVLEWLVNQGVDVDTKDEQGNTPLIFAFDLDIDGAIQNQEEITFEHSKKLLELGANEKVITEEGRTLESTANGYGKKVYQLFQNHFAS